MDFSTQINLGAPQRCRLKTDLIAEMNHANHILPSSVQVSILILQLGP